RDEEKQAGDVYDRFRARIMFPICNDVGEVIAFSGRLLQSDATAAKYLNSPETPLFRKGNVLFGLNKTKRALIDANCAIVCEGQLDLITLFEAGITNVVAPQGTAFTETQARLLKRFVDEVVLCFDADEAGQKAAARSLDALLQNDLIIRIVEMPPGEDPDALIRREGKEPFEKRIAGARDFFDYWIEREVRGTDLGSLSAKMQVARTLAETVSHVHDPMMRGEIVSKASARLGVPVSEFENAVAKQTRAPMAGFSPERRREATAPAVAPSHDIAMLCLLALRDSEARNFLLEQNWGDALSQTPNAELLVRILESNLRPEDPATLNSFMAALAPEQESLVSGWLLQKLPANPRALAESWWMGLRQTALRRQLEAAESRMRLPKLSTGEIVNLQKQILDLRGQLHELAQFSSARTAGS
ncbi:MAG TPA: toprim domain-containing protein, partial [Chthoniobacterales bacterium]|nr:toprim domain-containing protein [Chthoniobacterales bacterium]